MGGNASASYLLAGAACWSRLLELDALAGDSGAERAAWRHEPGGAWIGER